MPRTYTTFKVHFGFENYLSVIGNIEHGIVHKRFVVNENFIDIQVGSNNGKYFL
jgi:hypothetical protein